MQTLENALELIKRGIYMASIDVKDPFYSIPVQHQAYLTFLIEEYLKFACMPNGYGPAM